MTIEGWTDDPALGSKPCETDRQSWRCPNMLPRDNDTDMRGEHYDCKVCGRHVFLDYDEMS